MRPTRNAVFDALLALTAPLDVSNGGVLLSRSRKFQIWGKVPTDQQPALFQTEHSETLEGYTNLPGKQTWHCHWTVYLASDPSDPTDVPTVRLNDIEDSLMALFDVSNPRLPRQTLGGLVYRAWPEGSVLKVPGDDDGQGMLAMPISILVP